MIKAVLLFLLTAVPLFTALGQTDSSVKQQTIYEFAQEAPQFPGGSAALDEYLQKNLRYPENAKKAGIEGRVFVGFVVTKQGKITDVQAKAHPFKESDPDLVREAERLIRSMPEWTPGKVKGSAVACRFNVPVTFSLK